MKSFNVQQGSFNRELNFTSGDWYMTANGGPDTYRPIVAKVPGEDDVPDFFIRACGLSGNPREDAKVLSEAKAMFFELERHCRNCPESCNANSCRFCKTKRILDTVKGVVT